MIVPNRKLNRLNGWDYSSDGYYFVTICANNHGDIFGRVVNEIMILNDAGRIVWKNWMEMPKHYDNCHLDKFCLMPDHVHGVVVISNVGNGLETVPYDGDQTNSQGQKKHGLSEMIRGFKTYSSKGIHKIGISNFRWHKSFFDEVIRDERQYRAGVRYIDDNPKNWKKDL